MVSFVTILVAMFSVMAAAYDPTQNDDLDILLTSRKLLKDGGATEKVVNPLSTILASLKEEAGAGAGAKVSGDDSEGGETDVDDPKKADAEEEAEEKEPGEA
eukprot:CAMPEP_0198198118 /NCGR_PEP_ID=MMETSP1445-20131203/1610_1 /TAXON_ID=36898 /ORGANISM="Pyramimonas sp., Strain CCMP2087" /LENGTH=101 /DNA_ID=CAMNT_0043867583 /DNA_START=165 /DNA_END=467 /DNA_ORIENTATION=+